MHLSFFVVLIWLHNMSCNYEILKAFFARSHNRPVRNLINKYIGTNTDITQCKYKYVLARFCHLRNRLQILAAYLRSTKHKETHPIAIGVIFPYDKWKEHGIVHNNYNAKMIVRQRHVEKETWLVSKCVKIFKRKPSTVNAK